MFCFLYKIMILHFYYSNTFTTIYRFFSFYTQVITIIFIFHFPYLFFFIAIQVNVVLY